MLQILPQFKPQEISNTLWALATMNHYPAPSVIDTMVQVLPWSMARGRGVHWLAG